MDIIFLHNLKVDAVIGIWDWERKIRQTVEIDLDMAADIHKAAETDPDPAPAADYSGLYIEAGEYDDGFAKIVHASQPLSQAEMIERMMFGSIDD